jgi:hypothetical protein
MSSITYDQEVYEEDGVGDPHRARMSGNEPDTHCKRVG